MIAMVRDGLYTPWKSCSTTNSFVNKFDFLLENPDQVIIQYFLASQVSKKQAPSSVYMPSFDAYTIKVIAIVGPFDCL